ncbi:MAG: hypothetical protein BGO52_16120 [Sphingobacteriales bacterium 44-61]|nr:MAG: hypothetical protein BGO52_16120 [Sphingobacteriales bacterium 44-61]
MDVGRLKSLQRGENPALIFFKPARLLNLVRGWQRKRNYELSTDCTAGKAVSSYQPANGPRSSAFPVP